MRKLFTVALMMILILLLYLPVHAGIPMDTVQTNVNKVLDVLRDPKLKGNAAKETKKKKLRVIYDQTFDGIELGKRTLGRNWNSLTVPQRQEFVILFRQVLEKAYIDRILAYTNEKIVYERESMISKNQAEVQTKVVTPSKEIPIIYRVIIKDGSWKVYDVLIENVSLVMNYRTQFNDILEKNKPEQLLEILRKKVKAQ
jgi:phospholipid transport system substrate-binding protein